jgi:CIC family chloride channel protein
MLGAGVGTIAHGILPGSTANPGAYALVGMGAVFAGIIRVPLTSVFMIFELTRDYAIVVPVMIANLVSFAISRKLQPEPIYEALALQDGIHLPRPARERSDSGVAVSSVMHADVPVLGASDLLADVPKGIPGCVVLAEDGTAAALSRAHLTQGAAKYGGSTPVSALLLQGLEHPHVHPDHALEDALERMEDAGVDAVAVLDRSDVRKVRGMATLADVRAKFRE